MKQLFFLLPCFFLLAGCNSRKDNKETEEHVSHTLMMESNGYCDSVNQGLIATDTMKGSPHRIAMATINNTHVHIEYGSPGTKGRLIWGGLVAFENVWVTGAHQATSIQFSRDVEIKNTRVAKGTYAIFTIPGKDNWIFILNKNYEQHLADDYDAKDDLLRMNIKPVAHAMVPRLTYGIEKRNDKEGIVFMNWEQVHIEVPFKTL